MFKIVVFSDSHGSSDEMEKVIKIEAPDLVIFLGDGEKDIDQIQSIYDDLKVIAVRGNCDIFSDLPAFLDCSIQGVRMFVTHGHLYEVKYDRTLQLLKSEGKKYKADVVLFGHTHEPFYEKKDGMILMNPGTIGEGSSLSYATLNVDGEHVVGEIHSL